MMKRKNKAIRYVEQNASKGDISSLFQLYENYFVGRYVEKDEIKAKVYLNRYESLLNNAKFCLKKIKLTDFRKFNSFILDLDPRLTVIIGDNGKGKTTIAEAMVKLLSWFNGDIEKVSNNGKRIVSFDINVDSNDYAEIYAELSLINNDVFSVSLNRSIEGSENKKDSYLDEIRLMANLYRTANYHHEINLPLAAYYSVERSDLKIPNTYNIENLGSTERSTRFDAYKGALEGGGKFVDFLKWFIELDNVSRFEKNTSLDELKFEISLLEKIIEDVYQGQVADVNDPYFKKLTEKKNIFNSAIKNEKINNSSHQLNTVKEAIEKLVPDVSELYIDRSSGRAELMLTNFGNKVNITQVSKGQQTMIALAADLARRMVMLNPLAEKPLEGQGIVIIDELELHLHPKWQQSVLLNLQIAFPNIQFIITTHSPHLLSTVDVKSIRRLGEDEKKNTIIIPTEFQTKGVMSSDVLEQLMGTSSTPDVAEARWLQDFHAYIESNKYLEPKAIVLFEDLKKHFGLDHPEIIRCNSQIRLQELKEKARNAMNKKAM